MKRKTKSVQLTSEKYNNMKEYNMRAGLYEYDLKEPSHLQFAEVSDDTPKHHVWATARH